MSEIQILLRSVEMGPDGKILVTVNVQQLQNPNMGFQLMFRIKRESSLDFAVKEAERQLRNFAQDLVAAMSVENPLLQSITSR